VAQQLGRARKRTFRALREGPQGPEG